MREVLGRAEEEGRQEMFGIEIGIPLLGVCASVSATLHKEPSKDTG